MREVYTDGSCLGNPGPGGRACIITNITNGEEKNDQKTDVILSGNKDKTTNNEMELTAAIQALQWFWEKYTLNLWEWNENDVQDGFFASGNARDVSIITERIVLITDSTYVKMGITERMSVWKKRNRRRAKGGKLIENISLRKELDALVGCFSQLTRQWTKAHVGTDMNERVDKLARKEAERV